MKPEIIEKIISFGTSLDQDVFEYRVADSDYKFLKSNLNNEKYPLELYFHLLAHIYLPTDLNRCIYVDADVIINENIWELYNMDFSKNKDQDNEALLGMFYSITVTLKIKDDMQSGKVDMNRCVRGGYGAAGIIIYNLSGFRRNNINLEHYRMLAHDMESKYGKGFYNYDQGLITYGFFDKIIFLEFGDNHTTLVDDHATLVGSVNTRAKTIHYPGGVKPWKIVNQKGYTALIASTLEIGLEIGSLKKGVLKKQLALISFFWKYVPNTPFEKKITDESYYEMMNILFRSHRRQIMQLRRNIGSALFNKEFWKEEITNVTSTRKYSSTGGGGSWVVFNLPFTPQKDQRYRLSLKCKTNAEQFRLILSNNFEWKHDRSTKLQKITTFENATEDIIIEERIFSVNRSDFNYILFTSTDFPQKGDYLEIHSITLSIDI